MTGEIIPTVLTLPFLRPGLDYFTNAQTNGVTKAVATRQSTIIHRIQLLSHHYWRDL